MTDPCEGKYDIVLRLRDHINRDDNDIAEAAAYIERLRAERDEARREVCRLSHEAHNLACEVAHYPKNAPSQQEYAKSLGWDCFKENTDD